LELADAVLKARVAKLGRPEPQMGASPFDDDAKW
jgi:hypothetical protein